MPLSVSVPHWFLDSVRTILLLQSVFFNSKTQHINSETYLSFLRKVGIWASCMIIRDSSLEIWLLSFSRRKLMLNFNCISFYSINQVIHCPHHAFSCFDRFLGWDFTSKLWWPVFSLLFGFTFFPFFFEKLFAPPLGARGEGRVCVEPLILCSTRIDSIFFSIIEYHLCWEVMK